MSVRLGNMEHAGVCRKTHRHAESFRPWLKYGFASKYTNTASHSYIVLGLHYKHIHTHAYMHTYTLSYKMTIVIKPG